MRLWLSKNSEVPLKEQLAAQIVLGIVSDDLKAGQKLPSTRELARRFQVHANTVSAAYRDLEERGWLEFRKGSGVYVRERDKDVRLDAQTELDHLIATFLRVARARGFSLGEIQSRVKDWLRLQPPDHFLVIEPDEELRRILVSEISEATGFAVKAVGLEECSQSSVLAGAIPVALYTQADRVRAALPTDAQCLLLRSRSIPESLAGQQPPRRDALIAVVSRWPEFLRWARTILTAARIDPAALSLRDARVDGWQRGLRSSAFVITDALTAQQIPATCDVRIFRIISDSSLTELCSYVERFLTL